MATTIKDVAQQAKVSYNTVSEIINLGRENKFAPDTVERVKKAAQELGYGASYLARSLKTGRTYMVGVSGMAMTILTRGFRNPYLADVYCGIAEAFASRNYKLLFHYYTTKDRLGELCDLAKNRMVDGIIFIIFSHKVESFLKMQATFLQKKGFPFVLTYSYSEKFRQPAVGWDGVSGGKKAAAHLIGHGYGTIGFVRTGGAEHIHLNELERGFDQALREAGMSCRNGHRYAVDGFEESDGYRFAETLVASRDALPRALFVADDGIANGIIRRFTEHGIRVPEDVALITCGTPLNERAIHSSLTYLEAEGKRKGIMASEMLLEIIEDPASMAARESVIIDPELIIRSSCGCRA